MVNAANSNLLFLTNPGLIKGLAMTLDWVSWINNKLLWLVDPDSKYFIIISLCQLAVQSSCPLMSMNGGQYATEQSRYEEPWLMNTITMLVTVTSRCLHATSSYSNFHDCLSCWPVIGSLDPEVSHDASITLTTFPRCPCMIGGAIDRVVLGAWASVSERRGVRGTLWSAAARYLKSPCISLELVMCQWLSMLSVC